jgi:F0F1-type ATP synthase membrane subunit b/b'
MVGLSLLCGGPAALAQNPQWQKDHPRRHEVNKRLGNQDKRIAQGEQSGALTKGQANQLHREDKTIRREERQDAARDGGHITRQQQRQLNRQENQVSAQIHQEKHPAAP